MKRLLVREGPSGIVQLAAMAGKPRDFIPDCDLDQTLQLLFRLYDLPNSQGTTLKTSYWRDGYNWFSGQMGWLYWRACYRFVQYAPLLAEVLEERFKPVFINRLNFARLLDLFRPRREVRPLDAWYFRVRVPAHNRRVMASPPPLFFYRYGPNDFRSRDMAACFEKLGVGFANVFAPSRKLISKAGALPQPTYFLYRNLPARNAFGFQYDLSGLEPLERRFAQAVIPVLETRMSQMLEEYRRHLEHFSEHRPKLFFGLDDHNDVYPALFACKTLGIPSLGYQLGMYARRQAAYALERWNEGEYQWYDRVVCWGPYWERVARRYTSAWPEGFFLPGTNKNPYGYKRLNSPDFHPKNILLPYEFFANTAKIGEYIVKFMDLGYRVYFKLKPDQRPERQIACYRLPAEYEKRLVLVERITDELMAEINIVAGAMTTLLFDLLPYGKETWVLDTEFRLLEDIVQDGLARLVRLEDLDGLEPPPRADHQVDVDDLFNPLSLEEVLKTQVISGL